MDGEVEDMESSDDEQMNGCKQPSTSIAASLTQEGTKSVKMRLLDRLAEILCYKKVAHYVTCTAMQETDDEVNILALRNAAWSGKDIELLEEVSRQLEIVATKESLDIESLPDLQALLSEYYTPRLKYHASELFGLVTKKKEMCKFKLVEILKEFGLGSVSSTNLVAIVDDICYSTTFYSQLNQLFTVKQVKRITRELGFLCRPRYAFATFWEAAREIEGFQSMKITLVPGARAKHVPPSMSLCPQFLTKADQAIPKLLKQKRWIHAEMGMVTHLIKNDSVARTFPYLGISKKTWFMCGHILQSLAPFQARNNHGKVYSQWTLPSTLIVPSLYQGRLESAVQNLRDVLRHECAAA
ncbi:hypothetical protein N7533_012274 [Penicillium manginii]|uniref:uncharacterized protein n=1 Tax=Penicillium manginii TaxID=203109 RepID=UPI0025487F8E|nr:uncharacterized protein N7533_012274 [Penicillium manginii]KAJ5739490.1 hypothetical protein N7533_012274 [Penicillium manginii]